jgi:hypothetical protein
MGIQIAINLAIKIESLRACDRVFRDNPSTWEKLKFLHKSKNRGRDRASGQKMGV